MMDTGFGKVPISVVEKDDDATQYARITNQIYTLSDLEPELD